ncbi:hypothetical protein BJ742DRAFT_772622 [Cladochytrium replicatum]|nr:hypothetical protein BJ742DRAFT_772622 [Cladochytrium replicatum]
MLSLPMIHIVAAKDFDPHHDAVMYADHSENPLFGQDAISVREGQSLYAIGFDQDNSLFFATNCKQMPFCSIATTGYLPADVFHPVKGYSLPAKTQKVVTESIHVRVPKLLVSSMDDDEDSSDENTPNHSAGLSTPASVMTRNDSSPMEDDSDGLTALNHNNDNNNTKSHWDSNLVAAKSIFWNSAVRGAHPNYP